MTGKGKKVAIGFVVALTGLVLTAALSFGHGGHGARSCGDGAGTQGLYSGRVLDRLGIAGEQKTRIQGVLGKYRPETEPAARQLAAERRALRKMIREGAADENAIRTQSAKVASLESDLAVLRARAAKEVRSLLTAEQVAKLGEFEAKREKKADRMMERRFRGSEGEMR